MGLFLKHAGIHIRSAMEYKKSFFLIVLMQIITPMSALVAIYFMFDRFGAVKGWTFDQVLLCFAITYLSYSIAECFGRGFDMFADLIRKGTFDRLLVQPRNIVLLTFCSKFAFDRVGKACFALALMTYALIRIQLVWTALRVLTLVLMVLGGAMVFLSLWIAFATLCFRSVQGIEVTNIFTDGGRQMCSYPLDIYSKTVTKILTYAIPYGMCNYLPLQYLLGRADSVWYALAPLYAIAFFAVCVGVFLRGVRGYRSAG